MALVDAVQRLNPSLKSISLLHLILYTISKPCFGQQISTNPTTFESINDTFFTFPQTGNSLVGKTTNALHPITLVSMFYPGTKHSSVYLGGTVKIYLERIATPIVFFTPEMLREKIQEIRRDLPIHIVTRYNDPKEFGYISLLGNQNLFEYQAESFYVRPGKSAVESKIWNAKPMITAMTAIVNPFKSDIFVYVDAGGMYDAVLPDNRREISWPDHNKLQSRISSFKDGQILLSAINKMTWGDPKTPWFQGTWFAGNAQSIIRHAHQFYETTKRIASTGTGEDRSILSDEKALLSLVQTHPEQFSILMNDLAPEVPTCNGTWRVFAHTLKNRRDQVEDTNCVGRGYDDAKFIPAAVAFAITAGKQTSYRRGSCVILLLCLSVALVVVAGHAKRRRRVGRLLNILSVI